MRRRTRTAGWEPEDTVHPETLAFFDELLAGALACG